MMESVPEVDLFLSVRDGRESAASVDGEVRI